MTSVECYVRNLDGFEGENANLEGPGASSVLSRRLNRWENKAVFPTQKSNLFL